MSSRKFNHSPKMNISNRRLINRALKFSDINIQLAYNKDHIITQKHSLICYQIFATFFSILMIIWYILRKDYMSMGYHIILTVVVLAQICLGWKFYIFHQMIPLVFSLAFTAIQVRVQLNNKSNYRPEPSTLTKENSFLISGFAQGFITVISAVVSDNWLLKLFVAWINIEVIMDCNKINDIL